MFNMKTPVAKKQKNDYYLLPEIDMIYVGIEQIICISTSNDIEDLTVSDWNI